MSAIALSVELVLVPGAMDGFLSRVAQHRETVLAKEPGCLGFDILVPEESDNTVLLHEVYADAAAVETHLGTPHMQAYLADTGPMIARRHRRRCRLANG
ncbi:MAG: putative quinol monooxygenase [Kiloniellales bacterium]|nr:putative quinol monooxygenase [Kiloniellales bacterium]